VHKVSLRQGALEWRMVEGQVVALDLGASEYLSVNRSGAVIWPYLVEGATREELSRRLAAEFEIDHLAADRDVEDFLGTLDARGLLDTGDDAAPA
jgi:hypothetical protein